MTTSKYFAGDGFAIGEIDHYYKWTVEPNEDFSNDWEFEEVPESEYVENGGKLSNWRENELYETALRATCSVCVMNGRCVCGELDPEDEWENELPEGYWEDQYPDDFEDDGMNNFGPEIWE